MPLTEEEIEEIRKLLGRQPTDEELAMFEAQWSEHCSYKSSRRFLKLLYTKGEHVVIGPGRDAPAVEVFDDYLAVIKLESHNHPSAVDPYNGAATGIGGVIRDVLTLGAKPIALLDLLYLGDPRDPKANWLIRGIVKGISDYGNRIGVPTVAGDTWFDSDFNNQPLVNVGCLGLVKKEKLLLGKAKKGDLIIIFGNPTGRDGILGSSFASKALSSEPEAEIGAVQIGDPLTEKLLINAVTELVEKGIASYLKDLGGGGLATALSETLSEFSLGAEVHLEKLHLRTRLTPLEILVSESQERMLLIADRGQIEEVKSVMEKYELGYSIIGNLTDSGRLVVFYEGRKVADVPAAELARPKVLKRASAPPSESVLGLKSISEIPKVRVDEAVLKLLSSPNISSKKWIFEQYDYEVGIRTVVKPGAGDAAVLRLEPGDKRGIAVKGDGNPLYTKLDPFSGSANVVAECYRNLISVGSEPLAIVDELNAGNPEKPHHFWYFENMIKGISWMAEELRVPVVGGKVSFYNEDSKGKMVKPTATVVGIGRVENVEVARTLDFKEDGSVIVAVGEALPELGGTQYLATIFGKEEGSIPRPRPAVEIRNGLFVRELIKRGLALSVHDVGPGGLAVSIAEMSIAGGLGCRIDISLVPCRGCEREEEVLFSETGGRYIIEVRKGSIDEVKKISKLLGAEVGFIGEVVGNSVFVIENRGSELAKFKLEDLKEAYELSIYKLMR